jgi:leucyl/phenylalanyl-tRNA--protein transferase
MGRQYGVVPILPLPCPWRFPVPPADAGDLITFGADLAPGTLLRAYAAGLFPMPALDPRVASRDEPMGWWSPDPRGILPLDGLRVSRSLRQSARKYEIRVDTAFADVVAGCADPARDGSWITGAIKAAYTELHRLGWAHSVEAWRDGELSGGLYGVAIGGLFAGESMFSRGRDASKVALIGLVELLCDEYAGGRLLDTQWQTDHLATLGVVEVPRRVYLDRLHRAVELPLPAAFA